MEQQETGKTEEHLAVRARVCTTEGCERYAVLVASVVARCPACWQPLREVVVQADTA